MKWTEKEINKINKQFRNATPSEIVNWTLSQADKPIVTTNFRPYEAAILKVCVDASPEIPVIWCDSGYNTPQTYKHAEVLIKQLKLNIKLFVPLQTTAYRDALIGIPDVENPSHKIFTEQVKLEPFKRAMAIYQPNIWFTNLRKGQTALRDTLDIFSVGKDQVLKVSPFYYASDIDLDAYLEKHQLSNEFKYFDPTKVEENRECGLHTN